MTLRGKALKGFFPHYCPLTNLQIEKRRILLC
jgi:hypothetical protein